MKQEDFNEIFRRRTKRLALDLIAILSALPYSDALSIIRKQIVRSSTSTAANYRASCRARSQKERYAKLCIVVEESDETVFWIEMLMDGLFVTKDQIGHLEHEAIEIMKVMSSFRSSLGKRL